MASKINPIDKLTIKGFKSIKNLKSFSLDSLNVLIGPNGAGKSNFISYFRMLGELVEQRLQVWTKKQGGADRILSYGVKETNRLESFVKFGSNGYKFTLESTVESNFTFTSESIYFAGPYFGEKWIRLGAGHSEAKIKEEYEKGQKNDEADYVFSSISHWKVFHFHDTSETAGVKRLCSIHDNEFFRSDASNLAAFLYKLKLQHNKTYSKIRKTIALAIPFFDDFILKPQPFSSEEEQIRLLWKQKDSDYALWPSQLSDGSIRFICLTVALMQPEPPSTIIIDEPELGLHPYAIVLLGSLIRSAAHRMQVIISTQSVPLLNEFSIDDLIIVERQQGETIFRRHNEKEFKTWLEDYSVGELWEKNLLGGRPGK